MKFESEIMNYVKYYVEYILPDFPRLVVSENIYIQGFLDANGQEDELARSANSEPRVTQLRVQFTGAYPGGGALGAAAPRGH